MKTSELLRFYQDGRRDFTGINLQGADLAGQDLSGANFSDCQIQGANFRGANLTGAKFVGARSGLQKRWFLLLGSVLLSVNFIYSLCAAFIGYLIYWNFQNHAIESIGISETLLFFSIIVFDILYHKKLKKNPLAFIALTEAIIVAPIALSLKTQQNSIAIETQFANQISLGIFFWMLDPYWGTIIGLVFIFPKLFGQYAKCGAACDPGFGLFGGLCVVMVTLWLNVLAYFMGYFTLIDRSNFLWTGKVRNLLLAGISIGGTSFYKADLTDADFSDADVKNANFQKAILTGTCWRNVWNVHLARFDRSLSVK